MQSGNSVYRLVTQQTHPQYGTSSKIGIFCELGTNEVFGGGADILISDQMELLLGK